MQLATIECPLCGRKQDIDVGKAGQTIACSLCSGMMQLPAPDDLQGVLPPPAPPPPPPAPPPVQPPVYWGIRPPVPLELMSIDCSCGNRFQVPPGAAGLRLPCPACGQLVTIPVAAAAALAPAAAAEPPISEPLPSGVLLPPSVGEGAEDPAHEMPLLPPTATSWTPTTAAAYPEGEARLDPRREAAAKRARRRMVRNVVLWTIGMIALLATIVYLSR